MTTTSASDPTTTKLTEPAGLPVPLGNLSLWQRTVAAHPLLNARKDEPLPLEADVVVVGGGLCGAVLSYALLRPDEWSEAAASASATSASTSVSTSASTSASTSNDTTSTETVGRVVLLEARSLASGASGRNAGHCRPDAGRGFPMYANLHGEEEARRILQSEGLVLERTAAFIDKHHISCEWTSRPTYDVHLSSSFAAHSASSLASYAAAGGHPATPLSAEEGTKESKVECVGATTWSAATLNPAQLTLGVMELCEEDERFAPYSWAPVWRCSPEEEGGWVVETPRGPVRAKKVVWATNAYAPAVIEEMKGVVVPQGAQAHKLARAPAGRDVFPDLEGSYSLRESTEVFYSVAPRPDGSIVLGASRGSWPAEMQAANLGSVDDSRWHPVVAYGAMKGWSGLHPKGGWAAESAAEAQSNSEAQPKATGEAKTGKEEEEAEAAPSKPLAPLDPTTAPQHLRALATAAATPGTKDEADDNGTLGLEYAWTGIIGFTPDMVPLVGELPGKEGQFVAAGYCGHGMARIMLTAPSLAQYIRTGTWDPAMPPSFRINEERLARLRAA